MSAPRTVDRETRAMVGRNDAELALWLSGRPAEDVLEPDLEIVDSHHHLWDGAVRGRYLLPEFLADLDGGHNIVSTVYVECGSMYRRAGSPDRAPLGEVEFANGIAAMSASGRYGGCRVSEAIVGRADLSLGEAVRDVLEAELALSGGRLRGIRHGMAWDPSPEIIVSRKAAAARTPSRFAPPHLALDPNFRKGLAQLSPLGLVFDCFVFHPQLGEALDLARAFPDTAFVLDHVGGVLGIGSYADRRSEVVAEWARGIDALRTCPNVSVKVGGLGMTMFGPPHHEGDLPPTSEILAESWREYVERCVDAFGAERCMFESNFPPDKQSCSYTTLWNAFKRITAAASPSEKNALYSGTARRVYGLAGPTPENVPADGGESHR